ncbi:MAG TPA: helix-turn-helix transcriptional regulator, partial [Bacteroidia bacterium]|nr:helix-turn-helix transcriptional regulator [Bacteroidia bacterium]
MSDIESIGRRAREARLASNLAQAEVARAAGISTKALGDFERTGKIRLENFLRILEVLGRGEEADALLRKRTLTPDEIDRINAVRTDA